jgi:phytoene synthase
METLYAFFRVTDDLADEPGELTAKRENLRQWRDSLRAALAGKFTHPIHAALHDTIQRFAIPERYLFDVIDGVEMDLEPLRFATFAELYPYCYRVASAVGLACVRVWGLRAGASFEEAEVPAESAGIAFQLTNILRDLREDADRGRWYLPVDEETALPLRSPEFQIARAGDFYRKAEPLDGLLSREGRAIFHVMSGTYRALLREIEKRGLGVKERVRVPRRRKALFFLAAWPIRWGLR